MMPLISVRHAKRLIQKYSPPLGHEDVPLSQAFSLVLARNLFAPLDLPVADNSAMDGFAFDARGTAGATTDRPMVFRLRPALKAGDIAAFRLRPGEACPIMTGAPLPPGANSVLPKEMAALASGKLLVRGPIPRGQHVRFRGEEIKKGALALRRGTLVHAGTVSALASLGLARVPVFRPPKVAVIATGSELRQPGEILAPGKIYDANSWMLSVALEAMGLAPVYRKTVTDRPSLIGKAIARGLDRADVTLVAGGVSVGDYDWVKAVAADLGVETVFWKVAQKPGKPLFFGRRGRKIIFGLPGNPASVWTCFYVYVFEALRRMAGHPDPGLEKVQAVPRPPLRREGSKTLFLRGALKKDVVNPARVQGSHCTLSLAGADALIQVPPGAEDDPSASASVYRIPIR